MDAEDVVILLEKNWDGLRTRLGEEWQGFADGYRAIVAAMPAEPERQDLERTADRVCKLLERYEYGLGLLQGYRTSAPERLLSSAGKGLKDKETVSEVANRYRQLPERGQDDRAGNVEKDADRGAAGKR